LKKAVALPAVNKLYDIYDAIKAQGTAKNPFAVAMASWKELIKLKNGRIWVLKPVKKAEQAMGEQEEVELPFPVGMAGIGDGSLESFKDALTNQLKGYFGSARYVYITATYRTKAIVDVEDRKTGASDYYEMPYKVTKLGIEFGSPVKVKKVTTFQKMEQENWQQFRKAVQGFVSGKGDLQEVVGLGMKLRRQIVCRPES